MPIYEQPGTLVHRDRPDPADFLEQRRQRLTLCFGVSSIVYRGLASRSFARATPVPTIRFFHELLVSVFLAMVSGECSGTYRDASMPPAQTRGHRGQGEPIGSERYFVNASPWMYGMRTSWFAPLRERGTSMRCATSRCHPTRDAALIHHAVTCARIFVPSGPAYR